MDVEKLRAARNARPFVPFRIHFADGTSVEVRAGWLMGFSHNYEHFIVNLIDDSQRRGRVANVASLEFLPMGFLHDPKEFPDYTLELLKLLNSGE